MAPADALNPASGGPLTAWVADRSNHPPATKAMQAMLGRVILREPGLRPGKSIESLPLSRAVNAEALLAQMVGDLQAGEASCSHCQNGYGPFQDCVVVAGQLRGSCGNCHMNSNGSRCSFRGPVEEEQCQEEQGGKARKGRNGGKGKENTGGADHRGVEGGKTGKTGGRKRRREDSVSQKRAARIHQLLMAGAYHVDAVTASCAALGRSMSLLADLYAEEAGFEPVSNGPSDSDDNSDNDDSDDDDNDSDEDDDSDDDNNLDREILQLAEILKKRRKEKAARLATRKKSKGKSRKH